MSLQGKHAIISGGGSGAGAEIAGSLSEAGAKVTILGRRRLPLENVADANGGLAIICDVTDRAALDDAVAQAISKHGPVDIAIANAGAASSRPFADLKVSDLQASLDVNLIGVFNLWQSCLPSMLGRGWGRMIAIASTAGVKGYPYVAPYCAAKHGVVGLTRALALELAARNITVNCICPGFMETPMLDRSVETIADKTGMSTAKARQALQRSNPQDRFIQPHEVASAARWLCGAGAGGMNGHALTLSGGEI
ncbi:SDR family oxidoreductase [Pacificimonas sp. WHA3]|uniref:SDR family oxidoreductase n=1 Tax=Pacificimonas pallii TaxID=2827236 RepID=A0ABS6SAC4_9SPHN|nr:SDR family NAD(P)-dependent oxidoreductase [Pacificimonas pallii]MBV7255335.1 SDR family oxidoreductase [Pacificimonas pallii]